MSGIREVDFQRNNAFSLYDLHGHALAQEPCPGGHEINIFGRPFIGNYYYTLSLYEPCPGVDFFFKNTSILHFLPQNYIPVRC